ncbi:MAG: alpha/beta fold hydrolase [Gammaproteobacteria bacterium]|nr:alpha/beta fold hydrolase [Gammaproteobacteria bacterium]
MRAVPAANAPLQAGGLRLQPCAAAAAKAAGAWCGDYARPVDPHGAVSGTLPIYFEFYPHSGAGRALGTLVATEGGPGYPATASRGEYLALFAPLRAARDVLIMDNRGTGHSGAIDCPPLQAATAITESLVADCGTRLGARAPLFSTTLATDDLAALLEALDAGPVDLYGDSYGTFFAQVFALRHPRQLRSLVLDGAYPLADAGFAWYPSYGPSMRDKFNLACARSDACRALPGDSLGHIEPVLRLLRAHPQQLRARDSTGRWHALTADATALAIVRYGSAPARASVRELDAAARAYVAGDRVPLLRLMAETQSGVDSRDATQSPQAFSAGLAAAVMCQDAPQIFDMALPPTERMAERERAVAERKRVAPGTYAPFTIDEYRRMPLDYSFIDECVQWPSPPLAWPPGQLAPPGTTYPDTPTLVVSGDLDNMTPVADGAAAARKFARARQVIIRNGLHVNALPHSRSACGAEIVRTFIETLAVGDTACAEAVPEMRLVPRFARRVAELPPAAAMTGRAAELGRLRAITAAALAVGDVLVRAPDFVDGEGVGLRGGTFHVTRTADGYRLMLQDVKWTEDLCVSGSVVAPARVGPAQAELQLLGARAYTGPLRLEWFEGGPQAQASAHGRLGGMEIAATLDAP